MKDGGGGVTQFILQPGAPNSAKFRGDAEGQPRFDKEGGVAIIFYFLRVKNRTFLEFLREATKKGHILRTLRYKKVPFSQFLRKTIKKICI